MAAELDVAGLHRLFEVARPKQLTGEPLQQALCDLYDATRPHYDRLLRRPDGSRIFQLVFKRAGPELRARFLADMQPHIFAVATTHYSYHIAISIIKNGTRDNVAFLAHALKGKYDALLSHAIGMRVLDVLFEYVSRNDQTMMLLDFYGPKWKAATEPTTFADIVRIGGTVRSAAIQTLTEILTRSCDKGGGRYAPTHHLLSTLGAADPGSLGQFVIYLKDFAFSRTGSRVMIQAVKRARQNEIGVALKLLEEVSPPTDEQEANDEEEEKAEQSAARSVAAQLALDDWGWRVLACAISWSDDPAVVAGEVLPHLVDDWALLRKSTNALRVLVRVFAAVPSVFSGEDFQRQTISEPLAEAALPLLLPRVREDVATLGLRPDGSRLVLEVLRRTGDAELMAAVLTESNIVDPALHKVLRLAVKSEAVPDRDVVELVSRVGLVEVLRSPGAWVVAELARRDHELSAQAVSAIRREKIEGPAIEAIMNPRDDVEMQRKRPHWKDHKRNRA